MGLLGLEADLSEEAAGEAFKGEPVLFPLPALLVTCILGVLGAAFATEEAGLGREGEAKVWGVREGAGEGVDVVP